ncbi:MAG: hypothetical protein C5B54_03045 [Acidobacteria bacterium]|nr:MAG: hypothetical protein C5B54_03045 [Acidobacteriota bacterium]
METLSASLDIETLPDEEIVRRVLDGETELYELIMRRYNQRLYRVARSILRDDSESEDVMQDAYVRAYANLQQFSGQAKFSTWLTKIAVHEAFARLRRRKKITQLESIPAWEESMRPTEHPDKKLDSERLKSELEQQIEALPSIYRSVFIFREVEGLSTADTSVALDITEEVVKTRLHRARALLRKSIMERTKTAAREVFEFHLSRCDRVVAAVFERIKAL